MTSGTLTLTDFLSARIAEDEQFARAAIAPDRPGSHWHWVMDHNDTPVLHGHLQAAQDDGESVSLRTVEEYPTRSGVGPLPHFVVQSGEVHGGGGEHIARWDPARVLIECEVKRRIVGQYSKWLAKTQKELAEAGITAMADPVPEWLMMYDWMCLLALPYADHPDYRDEWRS